MDRDNKRGFLVEDISGTLLSTTGEAPQTKILPSESFVERVTLHAYDPKFSTMQDYLEMVFSGKSLISPHRYFTPTVNSLKRRVGADAWHVLDREEMLSADTSKAHPDSVRGLEDYFLNQNEAADLRKVTGEFNLIAGSGILYHDRLAALSKMGDTRGLFDSMVLRMDLEDTGAEVKYAVGRFIKARFPQRKLVIRDDCELTGLVMTGVADVVSLVNPPSEAFDAMIFGMPGYLRTNPNKIIHGRLARVLGR